MELERDLEQIIEKEEGSARWEALKRARRQEAAPIQLQGRPPRAQCLAVATGPQLPSWASELLEQIEAAKGAAQGRCSAAQARRERCAEEFECRDRAARDALAASERLDEEVQRAEGSARAAEEKLSWLEDISAHCEKGRAKQLFDGPVMDSLCAATSHLRRAVELQRQHAREAGAAEKRLRVARDGQAGERQGRDQQAAAASKALCQADEELKVAQDRVQHLEGQAAQLRSSVTNAAADVDSAEKNLREAGRLVHSLRAQYSEYTSWTEDLYSFFQGHGVRNINAICTGLQDMLPAGDPLPVVVRAMLKESAGSMDSRNQSMISMRELITGQIRTALARLKEGVSSQEAVYADCEQRRVEARRQMRKCEEQWRNALSSATPAKPVAVARPLRRLS